MGLDGRGPGVWEERIELLKPYQVNADARRPHGQPEREVHALPAGVPQPRDEGRRGDLPEVRPGGPRGHRRRVRVRATRSSSTRPRTGMHTIKAVMVATLGGVRGSMRVVVALGGNALLSGVKPMTADAQRANVRLAAAGAGRRSRASRARACRTATGPRSVCSPAGGRLHGRRGVSRSMSSARRPKA